MRLWTTFRWTPELAEVAEVGDEDCCENTENVGEVEGDVFGVFCSLLLDDFDARIRAC